MNVKKSYKIEYKSDFYLSFGSIWDYIANESVNRANKFKRSLQKKLNNLANFPYKYRKSYYYDNDNVRDFIFKGYTIPYLIDEENSIIIILDIFKWVDK